jgi:hypothetical protein
MATRVYSQQHYTDACKIWFSPDGERAARELNQMTTDEREKVWADLSGRESATNFRKEVAEDTKVIEEKLQELDNELLAIKQQQSKSSKAFDHAQVIAPEYTNNRAFRLMFLRSTVFDAQTAAASMVRHFETKLDLFGEETLGRKLLLSDLEEDDLDVFNTGVTQLVPTADVGGRKIVVDRPTVMKYKTRKNFVRISLHYSKGELVRFFFFFVCLFVCLENQSPHIFSKQTVQGSLVYKDDAMRRQRYSEAGGRQHC